MSAYVLSKKNSTVYHLEVDSVNFQTDLEVSGTPFPGNSHATSHAIDI